MSAVIATVMVATIATVAPKHVSWPKEWALLYLVTLGIGSYHRPFLILSLDLVVGFAFFLSLQGHLH